MGTSLKSYIVTSVFAVSQFSFVAKIQTGSSLINAVTVEFVLIGISNIKAIYY
nr:hypothetical protein [Clostridium thailandense]